MRYQVMLSFRMIVALVDISEGYEEKESPRFDTRTMGALKRRELVTAVGRLTKKGKAYLEMALFEYAAAEQTLDEHRKAKAA